DADARRLPGHPGDRGHGVGSVGLGGPHRVKAEAIRLLDEREVDSERRARVADVQTEPHPAPSRPEAPSRRLSRLRAAPATPAPAAARAAGPASGAGPGGSGLAAPPRLPVPGAAAGSPSRPRWPGD